MQNLSDILKSSYCWDGFLLQEISYANRSYVHNDVIRKSPTTLSGSERKVPHCKLALSFLHVFFIRFFVFFFFLTASFGVQ